MDNHVKALREALADCLRRDACCSRVGPVAIGAESCADKQCVWCRGRAALRAYELAEAERFRAQLSVRTQLDAAQEMAACLGFYERTVSTLRANADGVRRAFHSIHAMCNGALRHPVLERIDAIAKRALEDLTRSSDGEPSVAEQLVKDGGDQARDALRAYEQAKRLARG